MQWIQKYGLISSFFVYLTALCCSMGAMEMFSWLTAVLLLVVRVGGDFQWNPKIYKILWIPLVLMLWSLLSVIVSGAEELSLKYAFGDYRWIVLFGVFVSLIQYINVSAFKPSEHFLRWYFRFYLVVLLLIGLYATYQFFTGIDIVRGTAHRMATAIEENGRVLRWRSSGFFSMPLTYGYSMGMMLAILSGFLFGRIRKRMDFNHCLLALTFVSGAVSVFLSFTRGAWIAMAAGVGVVVVLVLSRKALAVLAIGVFTVFGSAYFSSPYVQSRVNSIADMSNRSNSDRIWIWKANLSMFADNPVFGVGYNIHGYQEMDYLEKMGAEIEYPGHAHNNFVQFLATTGGPGFLLFCFLSGTLLWWNFRLTRRWKRGSGLHCLAAGLLGSQVLFHVGGLTECNFFDAEVRHLIVVCWSCVSYLAITQPQDFLGLKGE